MASDLKTAWEFVREWYSDVEIQSAITHGDGDIPNETDTPEFAEWLTNQYRLAMAKGIDIARRESADELERLRAEVAQLQNEAMALNHYRVQVEAAEAEAKEAREELAEAKRQAGAAEAANDTFCGMEAEKNKELERLRASVEEWRQMYEAQLVRADECVEERDKARGRLRQLVRDDVIYATEQDRKANPWLEENDGRGKT